MNEPQKKTLATQFVKGLQTQDGALLRLIMVQDVVRSLPGKSLMSGEAHGVDAILKRTQILRSYGVSIAIEYVLFGSADVALALHNTGTKDGQILDEHLTSVLLLDGERIQRVNTYISDVGMLNEYFK